MKKTLKELTIKNNFMFGAVMCDEENCKGLLERVLQVPIERVEISKEKSIAYHPEYKGVRLDVYAKDENNTRYNVEMQATNKKALGKRARYYHSQIDMELIRSGEDYVGLPKAYVIFICDFDPFGKGKYCYTFTNCCKEVPGLSQEDGSTSIFLSTKGKDRESVSEKIVKFLEFVEADVLESEKDFDDEFVKKLQKSVQNIKNSREMEERYMLFEEYLKEERAEAREEGRREGIREGIREGRREGRREGKIEGKREGRLLGKAESVIELLEEYGEVSDTLRNRIMAETDIETLKIWHKYAAKTESIEQFEEDIKIV